MLPLPTACLSSPPAERNPALGTRTPAARHRSPRSPSAHFSASQSRIQPLNSDLETWKAAVRQCFVFTRQKIGLFFFFPKTWVVLCCHCYIFFFLFDFCLSVWLAKDFICSGSQELCLTSINALRN